MRKVHTLGLLGTGVIGGGWAARALHFGIDVIAADVKPEIEEWIRGAVANAEPALARLTFAPLPPKGKLTFTTDLTVMARQADFIQENIPEQLPLKQRMLAEVSRHAAADVIVASSTSGLTPTDLQRDMLAPERFCVAHPFNPVYLLPLVELVGGEKTAQATIDASAKFFTYIGMHPLHVRREVPGHLTDRLQEALWREVLHLVNDGVATTGELDESIIYGPGLRWAAMGTNLIYHLAGGESGMRHMLAQFGPCLKWPWTKLEAPELSEALIDRMVEGTQAQAAGRSRIIPCASTSERSPAIRRNATGVRSVISTRIRLGITRCTPACSTQGSDSSALRRSSSGTRTTLRPMSAENFSVMESRETNRLPWISIWSGLSSITPGEKRK